MTPPLAANARRSTVAAVALSLLLLGAYWAHPSRLAEARALWQRFYKPLPGAGISLDGSRVGEALRTGRFTEWTHDIARAALVRRNLRESAPHALGELQERWRRGLWTPPDPKDLEAALDDLVDDWNARRISAGTSFSASADELRAAGWTLEPRSPIRDAAGVAMVALAPPDGLRADALGSVLAFEIDRPDFRDDMHESALFWGMRDLGFSPRRRIVARIESADDPARVRLVFDLANEPAWLARGAIVEILFVDVHASDKVVRLHRVEGGDSPTLAGH